jgi:hypothetical protein
MPTQKKPEASYASTRLTRTNYRGPPLLKKVGGKATTSSSPAKSLSPPVRNGRSDEARKRSPSTDAPPESSSDEEEGAIGDRKLDTTSEAVKRWEDALKREEEKHAPEKARTKEGKRGSASPPLIDTQPKAASELSQEKRGASPKLDGKQSDEDDEWAFAQRPAKKLRMMGYGRAKFENIHAKNESRRSSQQNPTSPETKPVSKFMMPKNFVFDEPDETEKPVSGFRLPSNPRMDLDVMDDKQEDGKRESRFQRPRDFNDIAVDQNNANAPKFKAPNLVDIDISTDGYLRSTIQAAATSFKTPIDISTGLPPSYKPFIAPPSYSQGVSYDAASSSNTSLPTSGTPAIFDDPEDHSSSSLSSPKSPIISQKDRHDLESDILAHSTAKCPMCKQPVPKPLLLEWQKSKRTGVRYQQQFCKSHRKNDAEKSWQSLGYPIIDWTNFTSRIKSKYPRLEKILRNEVPSFYRNALASSIRSGADRTLQRAVMGSNGDRLSAGYYGPNGSQKMTMAIITRFAPLLRRLSTIDPLLSSSNGGGVTRFVQMILVPELTVLLIKEDMDVDDDGARVIMRESEKVGMEVNGEEDAEARDVEKAVIEARRLEETERDCGGSGFV